MKCITNHTKESTEWALSLYFLCARQGKNGKMCEFPVSGDRHLTMAGQGEEDLTRTPSLHTREEQHQGGTSGYEHCLGVRINKGLSLPLWWYLYAGSPLPTCKTLHFSSLNWSCNFLSHSCSSMVSSCRQSTVKELVKRGGNNLTSRLVGNYESRGRLWQVKIIPHHVFL